jgi:hypothetical protein
VQADSERKYARINSELVSRLVKSAASSHSIELGVMPLYARAIFR